MLRPSARYFLSAMRTRIKGMAGLLLSIPFLLFTLFVWSTGLQRGSVTLFPLLINSLVLGILVVATAVHILFFLHAKLVVKSEELCSYGLSVRAVTCCGTWAASSA